jgi:tripartite-type tricarboxylate transporter receptor subunit TctC
MVQKIIQGKPMKRLTKLKRFLVGFAVLTSLSSTIWAQGDVYPNKPIKLVITWPVGGFADTLGRALAAQMSTLLGQQVVVENRGGANGMIGADVVAKSAPDGYTLMFQSVTSHAINPSMYEKTPYSTEKDIVPIAIVGSVPMLLVANTNFPAKNINALIAMAKRDPDGIAYASFGNGSASHLAGALFTNQAGIKMTHVPYKGAGPAVLGLLGKEIDFVSTGPASIVAQVKAGKIRVLAHWGDGKLAALPDVPSLKSLGVNLQFDQWSGLFVPIGTPEPIVLKLRQAARAAATDDKVIQTIQKAGSPVEYLDAPDFQVYWDADAKVLDRVVRRIGRVE